MTEIDATASGPLFKLPGGEVLASDDIAQAIANFQNGEKGKPVIVSMGSLAASGGYYIAAAGDKIVANKGTLTGSIGVIGEVLKASKLYEMLNIKEETIKTGEHMDMGSIGTVLTAEQKQMLQKYQQEIYDQFKLVVATGRNMHVDEVERLAQGKIYSGKKAKELKLVDELGSIYDAIDLAKTGANITGKAKIIRVIKVNDDWFVLNSKTAALLGLDQIQLKNLVKQNMVELNSHIY